MVERGCVELEGLCKVGLLMGDFWLGLWCVGGW